MIIKEDRIRVLHIIKSLGRGGAETLLQETLAAHDKNQFEFHYIYFLPWKDQMAAGLEAEGGKVTNLPAKDNARIMLQAGTVIKYIRKNKIDLVHCHLPWAGFLGRLIRKRIGIPVIYTEHNKQERYHKLTRLLNKSTFNKQNIAIAVSQDVEESILKNIDVTIPVTTILNGVNTHRFIRNTKLGLDCRKLNSISEDAVVIGTISVFRSQKRLIEWIDLFEGIYNKSPNIYGIIVGDGILHDEVHHHIKLKGMEGRIFLPGLQTDVIPWLSAIDIFMMTSEFEGLPIALLEAMSMECAVVCTDAGGIKEVIRNGQDGFLHPVSEWQSMEKDILNLVNNKNKIRHWGHAARKRVVETFGINSMVEHIERLYLSILK